MHRRKLFLVLGAVAAVGLWYLFRPELLFVQRAVHEGFPVDSASASTAAPDAVLSGEFHGVAHETRGTATVYAAADGRRFLRLTEFSTSNGPDVRVYLLKAADAMDDDTVKSAGFLELGALKGTEGDQNYEIPAEADLSAYRAVTIWCRRFGVNFATAPLRGASS